MTVRAALETAWRGLGALIVSIVATAGATVWSHQLWRNPLGIPRDYGGDALAYGLAVEQVIESGTVWSDPRLGAPVGQQFQDWPVPEVAQLALVRFFGLFSENWAAVANSIYYSSFILVAGAAWWVLCRIGVSRWTASALAVLYALLPYHSARGGQHLFLATYQFVPLGVWLAWTVLRKEALFEQRPSGRLRFLSWTSVRTAVVAVLVGLSGVYYVVFTLVLLGAAGVVALGGRHWRSAAQAAAVGLVLVACVVASLAPALLFRAEYGANERVADRLAYESELYALSPVAMVLPTPDHRFAPFAEITASYLSRTPVPSESSSVALGLIGTVGFVLLLLRALATLARLQRPADDDGRADHLAFFALVALIMATIGGGGLLLATFVTPEVRAWNRISVVVAFLALALVGLLLGRLHSRVQRRPLAAAVLVGVVLLGVLDQTTAAWPAAARARSEQFLQDQRFFASLEAALPARAMVFQLPRVEFPEVEPIERLEAYGQLRPYLHTEELRWSFGGVKGRFASDWQERLSTETAPLVEDLLAVGYDGVYIAREAYADGGQAVIGELSQAAGAQTITSADGRHAYVDLRLLTERTRARPGVLDRRTQRRATLLHPVTIDAGTGFDATERNDRGSWNWAIDDETQIVLQDSAPRTDEPVEVGFVLKTLGPPGRFEVSWPGGEKQVVRADGSGVVVTRPLLVDGRRSVVEIQGDVEGTAPSATDSRTLFFRIDDLRATPSSLP